MKSKVQKVKANQGYRKQSNQCMNCIYFSLKKEVMADGAEIYTDKHYRCLIGGFAIKKTATCDLWESGELLKCTDTQK